MSSHESGSSSNQSPISSMRAPTSRTADEGGKAGKEGSLKTSNEEFIEKIFGELPDGEHTAVLAVSGDPETNKDWSPLDGTTVGSVCRANTNNYFNCATFNLAADGTLRARGGNTVSYRALVLDDVGSKAHAPDIVPTWILETSPGNFQYGYALNPPATDQALVGAVQKLVFGAGYGDKGAGGVPRWVRLPVGINGKEKYYADGKPFQCRLISFRPELKFDLEELAGSIVPNQPLPAVKTSISKASFQRPIVEHRINPDVFVPAAEQNPVLTALIEEGLYKRDIGDGRHEVTCPWSDEHTDGLDTGACFFEPSPQFPLGGYKCQHSHGDKYRLGWLLQHLDLDRQAVANLPKIRIIQGELVAMVEAATFVLAETGRYFQSGGAMVRMDLDASGYKFSRVREADLQLELAKLIEWERCNDKGQWRRSNPDPQLCRQLLQLSTVPWLPVIDRIAWQPMFDERGVLLREGGYHEASRTYCAFEGADFVLPEATRENADAAMGRLRDLLKEFRFVTPVDEAAAICGIFTAVLRPGLGRAPGFHYRAPASGSGKSYLSDTTAKCATPGAVAKVSYPRSDEEATKVVLAALRDKPAVLDFDDMATDWRPFGAINRLLTSPTMTDRILGSSEMATVTTDVLVLGSGNNTGPMGDLQRRVMVVNLDTASETPALVSYKGKPLDAVVNNRAAYVVDVLTIVLAWQAAEEPRADVPSLATYNGRWADYCRHTLLWMDLPDPAEGMIARLREDPDAAALGRLLRAWHDHHNEKPVTIRALLDDADGELSHALEDLPFVEGSAINRSKFGWYCKRNENRPVGGLRLEKAPCSERTAWRVVRVSGALPPSPASPASSGPKPRWT
ncbi:DNA-primase RepB domain-containing protein [Novosphingobium sp. BL-52-GroH]|uniref:DNA-primase RepB domain-containing protein n=1 Tax=Novosphingobium sp. BL-52-GroH TaxID=3349877 RepID=UPI003850A083